MRIAVASDVFKNTFMLSMSRFEQLDLRSKVMGTVTGRFATIKVSVLETGINDHCNMIFPRKTFYNRIE